jgi:hypothetical protein
MALHNLAIAFENYTKQQSHCGPKQIYHTIVAARGLPVGQACDDRRRR